MKFLVSFLVLFLSFSAMAIEPQIDFKFKYVEMKPGMEIYELKEGSKFGAGKMGYSKKKESLPLGALLEQSSFKLNLNFKKKIVMVYHNSSDQEIYFFSAPPSFDPVENSIGFRLVGPSNNKIFKVPPGSNWYRVVEFRLGPNFWGENLTITHTLIQVEATKAKAFSNKLTAEEDL